MRSFKQFLEESKSNTIYNDRGWRVILTNHSKERFVDRIEDNFTYYSLQDIVERGMAQITQMSPKKKSSYLVYSESNNRAVILSYEGSKTFTLVTILPVGKKNAKEGTEVVLVESYLESLSSNFDGYELLTFGMIDIKLSYVDGKLIDYDVNIIEVD